LITNISAAVKGNFGFLSHLLKTPKGPPEVEIQDRQTTQWPKPKREKKIKD